MAIAACDALVIRASFEKIYVHIGMPKLLLFLRWHNNLLLLFYSFYVTRYNPLRPPLQDVSIGNCINAKVGEHFFRM
jgi:hypothetical protein